MFIDPVIGGYETVESPIKVSMPVCARGEFIIGERNAVFYRFDEGWIDEEGEQYPSDLIEMAESIIGGLGDEKK